MKKRLSYEEIAELVDVHADSLLLFARQWSAAGQTLPRLTGRKMRKLVANVKEVTLATHSLVGLEIVPVVLGENARPHGRRWVVQKRYQAHSLHGRMWVDARHLEDRWCQVDGADQRIADRGRLNVPWVGSTPRPHIVWILAEDISTELACYGHPAVQTPNLDGLARQGAQYNRAFCTAPSCTPSRNAMMTGVYQTSLFLMKSLAAELIVT